ncbi:MAG TPA: hypothetical protein VFZ61_28780 [Polyangiales bacterium]
MSELPNHERGERRWLGARSAGLGVLLSAATLSSAHAQSWSDTRENPALWQIVDIDRSGEPNWPYGAEDVARDGVVSFQADEAGTDLRTVYAAADADRVWLRAYVAASSAPPAAVRAFFFLDVDGRDSSGGPAYGDELSPLLGNDLTFRGYERALGINAEGDVLGAWEWNAGQRAWSEIRNRVPQTLRAEVGSAPDPLAIGAADHGYLQVDVDHELSTLSQSCGGALFVRLVHEGTGGRSFGDDALNEFRCSAPLDPYGDPAVLRPNRCEQDDDCPANGRCRDGVCLFAYACDAAADCRSDETCTAGRCVRVVDADCTDNRDCDGLLCVSGSCESCTESGARACADGLTCSPNGSCVDTDDFEPGGDAGGGADLPPGSKVQGGALTCSASGAQPGALGSLLALLAASLMLGRRRSQRSRGTREAGE